MRKILLVIFIATFGFVSAQKQDSSWTNNGEFALNGSQASFHNWAKGGENQIAVAASIKLTAKYLKGKQSWDNLLLLDLGSSRQGMQDWRKGDDRIEFNTKYGHKANKNWYYSALFNFKTQFIDGYNYPDKNTKEYVSNFMAPGNMKLGLGMDYKPNKHFSLFVSPAAAKWTIVNNQDWADAGKFGLEPAETVLDTAGNTIVVTHASKMRTEVGALVRLAFEKELMKNVNFATIVELYSDYLQNPQNIDVDWQFEFTFKVNKFLNAQIKGHLIYDDDVMIDVEDTNGDGVYDIRGPRTQFNQALTIGLVYKI